MCWLGENPLGDTQSARSFASVDIVRDHDHLTGKYRGAAHNRCNLIFEKVIKYCSYIFHNFSGYDCHIIFEELLTQAYETGYDTTIIPKSMENYVSFQVGCLRFLDLYRFLSSGLDKLVNSVNSFPIKDSNNFEYEIVKKKLAYPYEYLSHSNFQEPLKLTKEDFW